MPQILHPLKVSLPSQAPNMEARKMQISIKREQLMYDYETLPKLALAKNPPPEFVELSDDYIKERMDTAMPFTTNRAMSKVRRVFDLVNRVEDYDDLFITIPKPNLVKDSKWMEDGVFAEQRLSGANPMMIRKLESGDVRAEALNDLNLNFNVGSELSKGNIYICDYSGTDPTYRGPVMVSGGVSVDGKKKWLPKPIAWFHWVDDATNKNTKGALRPLAIQLDASSDPVIYKRKRSRIYTPNETHKLDWLFAKICVQVADVTHHEMSSHLARCHFTLEPIAIATHRTLADEHPIALLLNTHMRFHIANDSVAAYTLIAEKGNVDDLLPGTLRESMAVLVEAYDKWDLIGMNFHNDLVSRQVDDDKRLPHFPYRDDGRLIWDIIEEWVGSYVGAFYKSDKEVANDTELQAFSTECSDQTGGARVKGMPPQITSRAMLVSIISSIIFVCGPVHSTVNFAQYEYMSYMPNMPFAIYKDIQLLADQKTPITEGQLMQILPTGESAERQLDIVQSLSLYKYDQFGNYDRTFLDWFGNTFAETMKEFPAVVTAYTQFKTKLTKAEDTIKQRNDKRPIPYPYMQPSAMLNSISI